MKEMGLKEHLLTLQTKETCLATSARTRLQRFRQCLVAGCAQFAICRNISYNSNIPNTLLVIFFYERKSITAATPRMCTVCTSPTPHLQLPTCRSANMIDNNENYIIYLAENFFQILIDHELSMHFSPFILTSRDTKNA